MNPAVLGLFPGPAAARVAWDRTRERAAGAGELKGSPRGGRVEEGHEAEIAGCF